MCKSSDLISNMSRKVIYNILEIQVAVKRIFYHEVMTYAISVSTKERRDQDFLYIKVI